MTVFYKFDGAKVFFYCAAYLHKQKKFEFLFVFFKLSTFRHKKKDGKATNQTILLYSIIQCLYSVESLFQQIQETSFRQFYVRR